MATTGSTTSAAVNNIYSSIAAKNKGLGGLISGLDTESLVEALTSGTRGRIATQQQAKTKLQWKQTAYRSVINSLGGFRTNYFGNTSDISKNMKYNEWYKAYKGTSSNSAITVRADDCSTAGTLEIEQIKSLASAKTIKSEIYTKDLKGDAVDWSTPFTGQTLTLRLDNKASGTYNIRLDSLDVVPKTNPLTPMDPGYDPSWTYEGALQSALNDLLEDALGTYNGGTAIVTADITGGVVTLTANANTLEVMANCTSLGLTSGESNRVSTGSTLADLLGTGLVGSGANGDQFVFSINGVEITAKADEKISAVMTRINNAGANVKISFDTAEQVFIIAAVNPGAGDTLQLRDVEGNFLNQFFGSQGSSTLKSQYDSDISLEYLKDILNDSSSMPDLADIYALLSDLVSTGATFDMKVNGQLYTVNASLTSQDLTDIAEAIEAAQIGKIQDIFDTHGLTYNSSDTFSDYMLVLNQPANTAALADYNTWYNTEFSVDTLPALEGKLVGDTLTNAMNSAIKAAMGLDYDLTIGFSYNYDAVADEYTLAFVSKDGKKFVEIIDTEGASGILDQMGFDYLNPINNYDVTAEYQLNQLGVTASTNQTLTIQFWDGSSYVTQGAITYKDDTSLHDLMQQFHALGISGISFTVQDGVLTLSSGDIRMRLVDSDTSSGGILDAAFGVSGGSFTTVAADSSLSGRTTAGTNAEIVINGNTIPSTNNIFNYNGITFEVSELFNETGYTAGTDETIKINVNTDHEGLADKIQGFIDDYNALVTTLYTLYNEEVKSDYAPLTEEQKADMTEEQIEKWENEAKKGILRNDSHLRTILDQMRRVFYEEVEAVGLAPYQIGITTQSVYNTANQAIDSTKNGLLELDRDKLMEALETNGDQVRQMFTTQEYVLDEKGNPSRIGVAHQLESIIYDAINPTVVEESRGSLVWVAGSENLAEDDSIIGKRIKYIDQRISNLKVRLENEYNRYWKKFTALETAISRMSAQTSWLMENT